MLALKLALEVLVSVPEVTFLELTGTTTKYEETLCLQRVAFQVLLADAGALLNDQRVIERSPTPLEHQIVTHDGMRSSRKLLFNVVTGSLPGGECSSPLHCAQKDMVSGRQRGRLHKRRL